ncbi:HNH endonuclease [Gulosibacter molinativorax]|uniref:HNH endonuclease n=1 Tax=Gulosibacter molinativorax TaxID=256821 RepID=A0ABT7CAA4_9MICO|nr:HNH endonuclease [Gulosibacter molinativorax]MDJ1372043.1 HNH endonuclease [Gulosibacter molinativorax]QUY63908.1 CRISPR-associated endonuclease Cas9 [Gulosibacter molinativorax]
MRTLVLNAGYEPISIVSDRRALVLVLGGKASVLEADESVPLRSMTEVHASPQVILLRQYVRIPMARHQPVSRKGVLRRDSHRCAYCDAFANTIDHVQPRSRGGRDSWENLVACCLRCNNVKGDRTPEEMGWKLRHRPGVPMPQRWHLRGTETAVAAEWAQYLAA